MRGLAIKRLIQSSAAFAALAQLFLMQAMALDPALHEACHHHHHHDHHHEEGERGDGENHAPELCVVDLISQGGFSAALTGEILSSQLLAQNTSPLAVLSSVILLPTHFLGAIFLRGPPIFFLNFSFDIRTF